MKKFYFIILIYIFSFIPNYSNSEIVYIDINFILTNSKIGKSLNNHIAKIQKENSEKYKNIELDLIEKEKLLLAQQNIIEKNEFENKIKILSNEINEFRSKKKKSNQLLNQNKIKHTREILNLLNPIITNYVDINSISLVIPKKNIVVGKKNLDITDEIIKLLNEKSYSLNF